MTQLNTMDQTLVDGPAECFLGYGNTIQAKWKTDDESLLAGATPVFTGVNTSGIIVLVNVFTK